MKNNYSEKFSKDEKNQTIYELDTPNFYVRIAHPLEDSYSIVDVFKSKNIAYKEIEQIVEKTKRNGLKPIAITTKTEYDIDIDHILIIENNKYKVLYGATLNADTKKIIKDIQMHLKHGDNYYDSALYHYKYQDSKFVFYEDTDLAEIQHSFNDIKNLIRPRAELYPGQYFIKINSDEISIDSLTEKDWNELYEKLIESYSNNYKI